MFRNRNLLISVFKNGLKNSQYQRRNYILGLESSCDDTAAAVLCSETGRLLGERKLSQKSVSYGGVIPSISMSSHAKAFPIVVEDSLKQAGMKMEDVKYIGITNRPGLKGSLSIGIKFAQYLSKKHGDIPLIPIHHMRAHALTPRFEDHNLKFPYLVLLISGGHSLLAFCKDIDDFSILGSTTDNSPGQAFDAAARHLRLQQLVPELRDASGGEAIEKMARTGDPTRFDFPKSVMLGKRDCQFSFSGIRSSLQYRIKDIESEIDYIGPDELIPGVEDLSAGFQHAITTHICGRVQRAFEFCESYQFWPSAKTNKEEEIEEKAEIPPRTLVVSGGVASNSFIKDSLKKVCDAYDVELSVPSPKYCTDNGLMIAWNAYEILLRNRRLGIQDSDPNSGIYSGKSIFEVEAVPKILIGDDISQQVSIAKIKIKAVIPTLGSAS